MSDASPGRIGMIQLRELVAEKSRCEQDVAAYPHLLNARDKLIYRRDGLKSNAWIIKADAQLYDLNRAIERAESAMLTAKVRIAEIEKTLLDPWVSK